MDIGLNIRRLREDRSIKQSEIADLIGMHRSNYSKIEKGEREPTIQALDKIARLFGMTVDQIIHYEGELPKDVTLEDKTTNEKLKLIEQLDDKDKQAIFHIIDGMLTRSKFKDFFNKNIAAL